MAGRSHEGRTVTLVLVDRSGAVLGALPPFESPLPWWPETWTIVSAVAERYGLAVSVLRLLDAERPVPHGGAVRYLAELDDPGPEDPAGAGGLPLAPAEVPWAEEPNRAAYARPGGPAAALAWAADALAAAGAAPIEHVAQGRSWNLSSIHRLGTADGPVWLKQVPWFFAHEPAVLRWLAANLAPGDAATGPAADGALPRVIAAGGGRMLLADVPGDDLHGAGLALRRRIAAGIHPVHLAGIGRERELLALGVPDRRGATLPERLDAVGTRLDAERRAGLDRFLRGAPARLAAVEAAGIPETLIHGDLHAGNARSAGGPLTIIDWGDSALGHPAFDVLVLGSGLAPAEAAVLEAEFAERWRRDRPGADPDRALALMRPVVRWGLAAVYAEFLDRIEAAEQPYHAADLLDAVDAAIAADAGGAAVSR